MLSVSGDACRVWFLNWREESARSKMGENKLFLNTCNESKITCTANDGCDVRDGVDCSNMFVNV